MLLHLIYVIKGFPFFLLFIIKVMHCHAFQYHTNVCVRADREDDYAITQGSRASRWKGTGQKLYVVSSGMVCASFVQAHADICVYYADRWLCSWFWHSKFQNCLEETYVLQLGRYADNPGMQLFCDPNSLRALESVQY